MTVRKIDHAGIVVNDLAAAKAFFLEFGLELRGEGTAEGEWVDSVIGLHDAKVAYAMMGPPNGETNIELIQFYRPNNEQDVHPSVVNAVGIRHLAFLVEDIEAIVTKLEKHGAELVGKIQNYENIYKLCYMRGPDGIVLEIAEQLK